MASIRTRALAGGYQSHTVTWRDPERGLQSRTFSEKDSAKEGRPPSDAMDKARELKDFLDANDNTFKLAAKAKVKKDATAPSVSDVVQRHIGLLRKPQPGTIAKYRRIAAQHIDGTDLGDMPIDKVKREHVITWLDGLTVRHGANQAAGGALSRKTKQNIQALLSAAFATAIEDEKISRNPAKGVSEADSGEPTDPLYLSPDDLDMITAETPEKYRLFLKTLCRTGMRYNEATAQRPRDVSIVRQTVDGVAHKRAIFRINRAWKATGGGEEIGPPKTKKAKRNVACDFELSEELVEHMETLGQDDFLFQRPDGQYLRNSWFHKYVWQPLVARLVEEGKLERKPRIHDLRAAHTTHLLEQNIPVHEVQDRLGHEDPQTTLRVYTRLNKDTAMAAADALRRREPEPQAAAPAPAGDDLLTKLERLGALREKGILSEDEFQAQKAAVLNASDAA